MCHSINCRINKYFSGGEEYILCARRVKGEPSGVKFRLYGVLAFDQCAVRWYRAKEYHPSRLCMDIAKAQLGWVRKDLFLADSATADLFRDAEPVITADASGASDYPAFPDVIAPPTAP
jgi:hypothetical protein